MTPEQAAALRKPFPKEAVGVLPKPYKRDSPKGQCQECHTYHGLPAVHLDYVGHAATTDRLLAVDPEWTWEPMATDPAGLPLPDASGNLWIRLTVGGVTRIGVGDGNSMKERIGDAIRNAAMRFGVALDLWSKEELEGAQGIQPANPPQTSDPTPGVVATPAEPVDPRTDDPGPGEQVGSERPVETGEAMTDKSRAEMFALFSANMITERDQQLAGIIKVIGREVESRGAITEFECRRVIDSLRGRS